MKVLIIGLGSIAQKHIKALRTLYPDIKIVALRSNNSNKNIESVEHIFKLSDTPTDIDFIIISNPTINHFETIQSVLPLNRPLFIEKPALHTLENASLLLATIKQKKIPTYVACNLRFHPCLQFVKKHLAQNTDKINEVNIYCGSYLPDWRKDIDFRTVYSANKDMGGGVHLDLIHELDYTYYLFDKPKTSYKTLKSKSSLNVSAIDYAHYILDYDNFVASITLNYFRKDAKRQLEIVFSHSTLILDFIGGTVSIDKEIVFEIEEAISSTYLEQMKYFTNCILNNKTPFNSFEESLEVLKICLNESI